MTFRNWFIKASDVLSSIESVMLDVIDKLDEKYADETVCQLKNDRFLAKAYVYKYKQT